MALVLLVLAGCSGGGCREVEEKYYEKVPVTNSDVVSHEEAYTYQQPNVIEVCGKDFEYEVYYDDPFWLFDTKDPQEPNQLKRTVYIKNDENTLGQFEFDVLFTVDGQVVERSLNPTKSLVDSQQARRLFLVWNTPYSPDKNIEIDVIDVPQLKDQSTCRKIVEYTNKTGTRTVTSTLNDTTYKNVIKTRTKTVCD